MPYRLAASLALSCDTAQEVVDFLLLWERVHAPEALFLDASSVETWPERPIVEKLVCVSSDDLIKRGPPQQVGKNAAEIPPDEEKLAPIPVDDNFTRGNISPEKIQRDTFRTAHLPPPPTSGKQPAPEHLPSGVLYDILSASPVSKSTYDLALEAKAGQRETLRRLERMEKDKLVKRVRLCTNPLGRRDVRWLRADFEVQEEGLAGLLPELLPPQTPQELPPAADKKKTEAAPPRYKPGTLAAELLDLLYADSWLSTKEIRSVLTGRNEDSIGTTLGKLCTDGVVEKKTDMRPDAIGRPSAQTIWRRKLS